MSENKSHISDKNGSEQGINKQKASDAPEKGTGELKKPAATPKERTEKAKPAPLPPKTEQPAETTDEVPKQREKPVEQLGDSPRKPQAFSLREKVLSVVAVLAIVAAGLGFYLYAGDYVPAGSAAKVNNAFISEDDVSNWIAQYRSANTLTDDSKFASALLKQNDNVATFRQSAANKLALAELIDQRAQQLGVVPTESQIQEQFDATKSAYSLSDDSWSKTMETFNLNEASLKAQYKANLEQKAVCQADVAQRDVSDDEVLSYAQKYLAGTTQKHAYRIVFSGNEAESRAQTCLDALNAALLAGGVDVRKFSELAKEYSDDQEVQNTGGSYAWSGSQMDTTTKQLLQDIAVGSFSDAQQNGDTTEIVFCDGAYSFPSSDSFTTYPTDVPDTLNDEVKEAASEAAWENDSNSYLATLLSAAKITYYPVPDNAAYNIDMSLASSN